MVELCLLEQALRTNLTWNKARINFLSQYLIALLKAKTVNGMEIALFFEGKAQQESHYRRIRRFFSQFTFCYTEFALFLIRFLKLQGPYVLTIDRTNWKFGKSNINILMMGIAYKSIAFPLFWELLPKRGNSNTAERISLIKLFLSVFGVSSIEFILADREFIGQEWIKFLLDEDIKFRIRIKKNTQIPKKNGQFCDAWQFFSNLKKHEPVAFKRRKKIWNCKLYLSGMRIKNGEYLILISSDFSEFSIDDYALRWEIETLFGCLKSRGFRMEETHLTDLSRIKKLVGLLAIAFCWCHVIGEWLNDIKPLKIKNHKRLEKSIFRYGLDLLRRVVSSSNPISFDSQNIEFKELVIFLSCT